MDQRYHFDGVGRMDQAAGWLGKQRNFTFDNLGRLQQTAHRPYTTCPAPTEDNGYACAQATADSTRTYSYDQVGNRTDLSGSYTTGNRITNFNGCSYGTDYDGNITLRQCGGTIVYFTWSAENRLTGYSVSGGPTVTMDYDAGGRLSRRASSSAGTTYLLWAGANLVSELDATGANKLTEYSYYGLDRLHSMVVGTTYYHAHQGAQGNVLALTDQNRNLARTYNYEDFGRGAGGVDYANLANRDRARWKGAMWMGPEVELYYMRNRWYEPQTGRFLSEDPIGLGGGINPYAFAGADPIGGFDPLGLEDCRPPKVVSPDGQCVWVTSPVNVEAPAPGPWVPLDPMWLGPLGGWGGTGIGGSVTAAGAAAPAPQQKPSCNIEAAQVMVNAAFDGVSLVGYFVGAGVAVRGLAAIAEGGLTRVLAGSIGSMGFQTAGRAGALREIATAGSALARQGAGQVLQGAGIAVAANTPRLSVPFEPLSFGAAALLVPGVGTYRAISAYRDCKGGR